MCELIIVWDVEVLIPVDIPVILEELIASICRLISSNFRVKGECWFEMLYLSNSLHCITFQDSIFIGDAVRISDLAGDVDLMFSQE